MVYQITHQESYWTLPGGHVEPGETPQETAAREFLEETGIVVVVGRCLWEESLPKGYTGSIGRCYLVEAVRSDANDQALAADSWEDPGLDPNLGGVSWRDIDEMRFDSQVSQVVAALGLRTTPTE